MIKTCLWRVGAARTVICGSVLGAAAASSPALAEPGWLYQNRESTRVASLAGCDGIDGGFRCTQLTAVQVYDRRGLFESASLLLYEEAFDGQTYSFRQAECPVSPGALAIRQADLGTALIASVEAADCQFNFGFVSDGAGNEEPYGFSGTLDVSAQWQDPAATTSSQSNGRSGDPAGSFSYTCIARGGSAFRQTVATVNGQPWAGHDGFVDWNRCNVLSKAE